MRWLSLELTGRCQLRCTHCYADSSPLGTSGTMTTDDWSRVIDQAADHGVEEVQFIGGEPTTHPAFARLVDHALSRDLAVEVYSNLVRIRDDLWRLFERNGVALATSYYSDRAMEHESITGRTGSHAQTRSNITQAVRRGIPIRVAIIEGHHGRRTRQTRIELAGLGVSEITVHRVRRIGRAGAYGRPEVAQLCGRCGWDRLAIGADGEVWPCTLARSASLGDVRKRSLESLHNAARTIAVRRVSGAGEGACAPSGETDSPDRIPIHGATDPKPLRPSP